MSLAPGRSATARPDTTGFLRYVPNRGFLVANVVLAVAYTLVISFAFEHGNWFLFAALLATELFHLVQIVGYCWTVWGRDTARTFDPDFNAPVDVFITVCGEPVDVVRETARAAQAMRYPTPFRVYLLNDGLVAGKDDWREIEELADELGVTCITRVTPGGAKAGNINHALSRTDSPFFVVFDADHVPHADFLAEVMGYFVTDDMGFVQTPQFYANQLRNRITRVAWDQQTLFFGPIMAGKSRLDSAFMCGTNMAVRRSAIADAGGMCEFNIAEDFLTSLFMHERGWKSVYVPKVLAEGLAPDDFLNYYKQQFRWTRGSLEVIFKYNPLLRQGLSTAQKLQYLLSASYYLSGSVILLDALLPIVFLLTGETPIVTSTMTLALVFVPYMWINLYVLQRTSNFTYSYQAIAFSLSAWWLQITALVAVLANRKTSFAVTSKTASDGARPNFLRLVVPQLVYAVVAAVALAIGAAREGASPSLMANVAWLTVHLAIAVPFIMAASPSRASRSASFVPASLPSRPAAAAEDRATAPPTPSVEPALQPAHD
ncbi:glycosyltransferase [Geodermatophilus obscurus]|uniref:Cellulose synthase (UDP-forming) n=1 Tax=Geodermatophilus obscurus (strain ATCC 25078 / DSM 43160 / JCM 3152 / CCUG 61914 / KCC A-0152 / KCTC 9177 / NBRC 13315 / NRRL B-3577 / G-20) TaxID=526225 RepID=D2S409_GEOOG|nr:cellulose synthase catalytic subunit [Geodermatophilus obscurus]ADB73037.1 Cellulose synthase (UDP-forming) [Geodermatophilus obscurus DSM 43160]